MPISFLLLLLLFSTNISLLNDTFNIIKLTDFTKTRFTLQNEFVFFEYKNNYNKYFDYGIDFIFDEGQKSSTKVYYYDSVDKIQRGDNVLIIYMKHL